MFTLVTSSKFFFLGFAEELERRDLLDSLIIGYPKFKLKNLRIKPKKLQTFPYLHSILVRFPTIKSKLPFGMASFLNLLDVKTISKYACWRTTKSTAYIVMSGLAFEIFQHLDSTDCNDVIICRSSRHILEQKSILEDASRRWSIQTESPTKVMVKRELFEYERAKKIIVPSKICKESFIRQGVPAEKVSVVYFPFQLSEFQSNFHKVSNLKVITFVGQVSLRKGICVLIEALNKLKINEIEIRIVGSIHPSVREFLSENRVEHLNVIFYGHVSPETVREILDSTDIFVMPSLEEGWPMAMMEAISMGCIPLVSDAICTVDELPVPNTNFIFQSENSNDLAIKIEYILDNLKLLSDKMNLKNGSLLKSRGWSEFVDDILKEIEK